MTDEILYRHSQDVTCRMADGVVDFSGDNPSPFAGRPWERLQPIDLPANLPID